MKSVLTLFKINSMKANSERFQFLIVSKTRRHGYDLLIDSNVIIKSAGVELVGLIIDNELSFEKHIVKICQAASYKLHELKPKKIRRRQSLAKCFCGFSIQLCFSNLHGLQENYFFQNTENSS